MKTQEKVRTAMVSGQFYPEDPRVLQKQIRGFLSQARSRPDPAVRALIVPHAGYDYSGPIAAEAYKLIEGRKFDSVVIIAFFHRVFLQGVLVDDVAAYETPLGRVPVDRDLAREIRMSDPVFQDAMSGHFEEHSLEVQIPFLQETVPELKIVPVYIGVQNITNITALADALAGALAGRNALVVATTDLSHFHPYEIASEKDKALIGRFEKGNVEAIYDVCAKEAGEACGMGPVLTSILLAKKMKWSGPCLIQYANSGDVTGERNSVVGYAAMAFGKSKGLSQNVIPECFNRESSLWIPAFAGMTIFIMLDALKRFTRRRTMLLSESDQKKILVYAREFLKARLTGGAEPELELDRQIMEQKRGIFVTLKLRGHLRGCIGHILGDEPLKKSISHMTLAAAFEDPRFPPLAPGELKDLEIHISLLTEPVPVKSYEDIRTGTDGIIVSRGWKKGVYLPEVAIETGWNSKSFFESCALEKAGLSEQELGDARIEVFQTEGFGD